MLKKLNTKALLIIFIVLAAIVLITLFLDEEKGSRTFKDELVNIDTSMVNTILLYPSSGQLKEIIITKSTGAWKVQNENVTSEADTAYIANLLSTFTLIKPQRLAATDKSKWKEYNVDDSLGTRVKFLAGDKVLADIVVGKFSYNQMSRSGISYVRLSDEDEVFAVDGFIPMAVNQPFNEWRNKSLVKGNKDDWTKISFGYRDSSFALSKTNGRWGFSAENLAQNGDAIPIDSIKVDQYLSELSYVSNSGFLDNYTPSPAPEMTITIEGNNMAAPITIKAFPADSVNKYGINSSFNPNAWFSGSNGNLSGRIFKKFPEFILAPPAEEAGKL